MAILSNLVASMVALSSTAYGAGTTVRQTNTGPTGYEVTFVFTPNATQSYNSVILGGFPYFSNPICVSNSKSCGILPSKWKPDDFVIYSGGDLNIAAYDGFEMNYNAATGDWKVTIPMPSGTFNYAFYPNCNNWHNSTCHALVDPSNPPIQRKPGDQLTSTIQVPFDGRFQRNNYDWLLPLPNAANRGNISFHQYPLKDYPGFLSATGIYLPAEYGKVPGKKYKVAYLHHGGGGTDSDWFSQGRAHNMFDRLIDAGRIEPTILVTPNFYAMPFSIKNFTDYYSFYEAVRKEYLDSLIPWVDANYETQTKQSGRAFGGLSLGGGMTLNMMLNATSTFAHFCPMSQIEPPPTTAPQWNNTELKQVGIFTGAGLYDFLFDAVRDTQLYLGQHGILTYLSHFPANGAHQWQTWEEILYYWALYGLWQPVPYKFKAQQVYDLSGAVPY